MSKFETQCWDANIFIAWLAGEETHLDAIATMIDDVENNRINLVLPAIVYCEVLECHHDPETMQKLKGFLRRSNVVAFDVTEAMATRAAEIRNRGKLAVPRREIKTPDALYIATALKTGAKSLITTEERILHLDGTEIVEGLPIKLPQKTGLF